VRLPSFERFVFRWDAPAPFPEETIWSTRAQQPDRLGGRVDPTHEVEQIVAEDIQCAARISISTSNAPLDDLVMEIGAFFAPKNHIRPDWLQLDVPVEAQFPGAELQGR
jgi:hypothetical protein